MAVYLDHQLQALQNVNLVHELIKWHRRFPVLAVASHNKLTGSEVNLFYEEGERITESPIRKAVHHATALQWHPVKKILCIGWSTGEATVWNVDEREFPTIAVSGDSSALCCVEWSSEGRRLMLVDETSTVFIYSCDINGRLSSNVFAESKLDDVIKVVLLKPFISSISVSQFAKADSGVEADTLDSFVAKKETMVPSVSIAESSVFFLGGIKGHVYCVLENGTVTECFSEERAVVSLLFYNEGKCLVTVLEDLTICQHLVGQDYTLQQLMKVKLSGKAQKLDITWAGAGVLAVSTGESVLRLWELETQDNYVLQLDTNKGFVLSDSITCLSFSENRGMLAAGTAHGHVAMWKCSANKSSEASKAKSEKWLLQAPCFLQGSINKVQWARGQNLLAVCTSKDVFILREQAMCGCFSDELNQNVLSVYNTLKIHQFEVRLNMQPKGIDCTAHNLIAWDGKSVTVLEITDTGNFVIIGTFPSSTPVAAINAQSVYVADPGKIQVRTFQGTVKQIIALAEQEDDVCCIHTTGTFLAVGTTSGFIRIFDLSRREAKSLFYPKYVAEGILDFGSITNLRLDSTGNRIAYTLKKMSESVDSKLYIWDAENDSISYFNFYTGFSDQDDYEKPSSADESVNKVLQTIKMRYPVHFEWDKSDPRYLVSDGVFKKFSDEEAESKLKQEDKSLDADSKSPIEVVIASFFVTGEHGVLLQDVFPMSAVCEKMLGVSLPYIYFSKKPEFSGEVFVAENLSSLEVSVSKHLIRRTCRDFVGMESADKPTKEALTNFSFYLTVGNLDEAFKSVKLIKSESVWENMAQMCIKTQRIDVAAVCLGNMGNARGARALREAMEKYSEPEVHLGILAMQLRMVNDAERLFLSCKRYDLLNQLYQMTNNWKKAIDVATTHDRVHLRNTFHAYAKHLENIGALQGAIDCYEKSDTHRFEVPRMLFDNPTFLEQYVKKSKDGYLRKWWAQYLESLGDIDAAMQFYNAAEDYLSVVRLHCYVGNTEKAAEVANETGNKAACYHLARNYESNEEYKEAVHFFTKAHAYGSAIRLCKEHKMVDKIAQLALMSTDSDMIEAAKFYENKPGMADKAIMLYHKAGMFGRALELAFRTEQFSALDLIAADLNESSDPRVLERCAEFFVRNQQFLKAVQLLGYAKKYREAIELCSKRNVPITEQLAELLTPTKEDMPDAILRNKLLEQLADCCIEQGHYHSAAKKFTQAGSKLQAIRALLRSGDTEKIIFFANAARTKEIYIMAANYLQTTDWKSNAEIIKSIISFYTKAQALEHLSSFYDACAQAEIDEYRDYEKALDALTEALRCNEQIRGKTIGGSSDSYGAELRNKIQLIRRFLEIRGKREKLHKILKKLLVRIYTIAEILRLFTERLHKKTSTYEANPTDALKQLQDLVKECDINSAVRLGDIYAILILHHVKKDSYKKAYQYLEELKAQLPEVNITHYIKPQIVNTIYRQLNIAVPTSDEEIAATTGPNETVREVPSLQKKMASSED